MSKNQEQKTVKPEQKLWVAIAKLEEYDFPEPHIFNPDNFDKWEIKGDSLRPVEDLFPEWFMQKTVELCEKHLTLDHLQKISDEEYRLFGSRNGNVSLVDAVCYLWNMPFLPFPTPPLFKDFEVLCAQNPPLQEWKKKWCLDSGKDNGQALLLSLYGWQTEFLRKKHLTLTDYKVGIDADIGCNPCFSIYVGMQIRCDKCGCVPNVRFGSDGSIDWESMYACKCDQQTDKNAVIELKT